MATRRDGFRFPCGQCLNCKINKRRDKLARLLLEAASHDYSAFVTLTFRDLGTPSFVRRSDIRHFIRSLGGARRVRYYAAAEYGTRTGRAHYHVHLFSRRPLSGELLTNAWPYGHIHIGDSEPDSFNYALGYLLKNAKAVSWPIEHRWPEFRSSSKGIGRGAFPDLCISGSLPREFRVYGQLWPIGRYYRSLAKKEGVVIDETRAIQLDKFEASSVRALLANPALSEDEVASIYESYAQGLKEKQLQAKKKAIRAAYLEKHGHSLRKKPNETF